MSNVRWSLMQRLVRGLLALPDGVLLRRLGAPTSRDGRVLDRRIQLLLALGRRTGRTTPKLDPVGMREELLKLSRFAMPTLLSVGTVDRVIEGPAAPIPVRIYRSQGLPAGAPAIVYLHGGGWVNGNLDSHDGSCRMLADISRCVVVAVDYRRAPEHPFPAAVDDSLAAYLWVQRNSAELGTAPGRVGVMGDSAGGNLAAVVSLAAREESLPLPLVQGLVYPAVDMEFRGASFDTVGVGFGLERITMEWFREQYVPQPELWRSPRVSPLYASDLSGLPPALIYTAGFDPLREDGRAYADALTAAGVPVRFRCYDDTIHGFFGLGLVPGGLDRVREVCTAMGELMHAPS